MIKASIKIRIVYFILFTLFIFPNQIKACSIFCAAKHGKILAAGNEDWSDPFTKIWVRPSTENNYGSINLGHSDYQIQTAINEHGLFFDFAAIETVEGKNLTNKVKFDGNLFAEILSKCKTVAEALEYLKSYQYQSSNNQVLLADATGSSIIINQDAIIGKKDIDYQIITNFNACKISTGNYDCRRYQIIDESISKTDSISVPIFKSLLSRTHQEGSHPTQYSYVFDLKEGVIHLYSFHNYDNEVVLNVKNELIKGYNMRSLKELFPVAFEEEYFRLHSKDSLKQAIIATIKTHGVDEGLRFYKKYSKNNPEVASYPFVLWDIGTDLVMSAWVEDSQGQPWDYWWYQNKYLKWKSNHKNINAALKVYNMLENDISGEDPRQYIGVYEMKAFVFLVQNNIKEAKMYLNKTLQVATEETGNYQRANFLLEHLNR